VIKAVDGWYGSWYQIFNKGVGELQCDVCVLGKVHKAPIYNNPRLRAEKVGQMFYTDMCGPMSIPSINGNRWLCIVVDNVSRLPFPFFMKNKDNRSVSRFHSCEHCSHHKSGVFQPFHTDTHYSQQLHS
jgi:hypothetical protein